MIPSLYFYVFVHRSQGCYGVLRVDLYRFTSIKFGLDYIVRVEEYLITKISINDKYF